MGVRTYLSDAEETEFLPLLELEPNSSVIQPVTTLYQLCYPGSSDKDNGISKTGKTAFICRMYRVHFYTLDAQIVLFPEQLKQWQHNSRAFTVF